jgi:hypothetical protein
LGYFNIGAQLPIERLGGSTLYHDFYVKLHLMNIREQTGSEEVTSMIERIIQKEVRGEMLTDEEYRLLTEFTDYLNFF